MPPTAERSTGQRAHDTLLAGLLTQACDAVGLNHEGHRLVRHFDNAVYYLPSADVVARTSYKPGGEQRAHRALAVTRWLSALGFPATAPVPDLTQPVVQTTADGLTAVTTFWHYYPQPKGVAAPSARILGELLSQLHALPAPALPLLQYEPLTSLQAALDSTEGPATLDREDHAWLTRRIVDLRAMYGTLTTSLGAGLVHADAHPDNLLYTATGVVLGDWDSVCSGPRELDLIAVDVEPRFGAAPSIRDELAAGYGKDIRELPARPLLHDIYTLSTLSALVRLAAHDDRARRELHYRVTTLRQGTTGTWTPW